MKRVFTISGSLQDTERETVLASIETIMTQPEIDPDTGNVKNKNKSSSHDVQVDLPTFGRRFKSMATGGNRGLLPPGILWVNAEGSQFAVLDPPQYRDLSIMLSMGNVGTVQIRLTLPIPYVVYGISMASPTSFYVESVYFALSAVKNPANHVVWPAALPNVYTTGKLCTHHPIDVTEEEAEELSLSDKINLAVSDFWSSQFNEEVRDWYKHGLWRLLASGDFKSGMYAKLPTPPKLDVSGITGARTNAGTCLTPDNSMAMFSLLHRWAYLGEILSPWGFCDWLSKLDWSNVGSQNYLSQHIRNGANVNAGRGRRGLPRTTAEEFADAGDDTLLDIAVAATFASETR